CRTLVKLRGTMERHIVGLGGGADPEQWARMRAFVLGLTGKERPKLLFVPTAVGDEDSSIASVYEAWSPLAQVSVLRVFPWPPQNLRELILAQDAINVSGGNTANMLAIWRVHGIDTVLREAWENGVVLFGASA